MESHRAPALTTTPERTDIPGAVAVVIGGATGIGAGLCRALCEAGATVDIVDIDLAGADELASALRRAGARVAAWNADITDPHSLTSLEQQVRSLRGRVDLLFVNAGSLVLKPFLDSTVEDWRWLTDINLIGTTNAVRAFLPGLLSQKTPSRIIVTSSMSALRTADLRGQTIYAATKAAQLGFCAALEAELKDTHVSLSVVFPGPVATSLRAKSERARPGSIRVTVPPAAQRGAMSGDEAGRIILDAVRRGRRYITTHPDERERVEARFSEILAAFAVTTS